MRIAFDDIPVTGLEVSSSDASWLPAGEFSRQGEVACAARLERDGDRVMVEDSLRLTVLLACDRCLEEYAYPIDTVFAVDLEWVPYGEDRFAPEHACGDSEMEVVLLDEPAVDLDSLWEQQFYLSLPEKRLCGESCAGLCPVCGGNRNREQCACASEDAASSPFAVLAKLKRRK
ncbi:MAG: YceD family protein [Thermodesulfobacteriota bacterium]